MLQKLNSDGCLDSTGVTVVSPRLSSDGWPFGDVDPFPGAEKDPFYGAKHLKDIYFRADPSFAGRFTVPVLWDKRLETIVNNESSEIVRIFNTAFNSILPEDKASLDLYPEGLRNEIDDINGWVYDTVNSMFTLLAQSPYVHLNF